MKISSNATKKHARKPASAQAGHDSPALTFSQLEALCDDPKRNETGEEVQPVLTRHHGGYLLSVRDGLACFEVVEDGKQVRFRSIEAAVERLSDVPYLMTEIILVPARKPTTH